MQRTIEVDAPNAAAAERQVRQRYRDCELVLDAGDFVGVEFQPMQQD
jgi:hypothetical protein